MPTMLDLDAPSPRRAKRRDNPFDADVTQDTDENAVRRVKLACDVVLADCARLIDYSILDFEQMNLVFRCERFYKDNKHLGVHWLKQLRRLVWSKQSQLKESVIKARFIG